MNKHKIISCQKIKTIHIENFFQYYRSLTINNSNIDFESLSDKLSSRINYVAPFALLLIPVQQLILVYHLDRILIRELRHVASKMKKITIYKELIKIHKSL